MKIVQQSLHQITKHKYPLTAHCNESKNNIKGISILKSRHIACMAHKYQLHLFKNSNNFFVSYLIFECHKWVAVCITESESKWVHLSKRAIILYHDCRYASGSMKVISTASNIRGEKVFFKKRWNFNNGRTKFFESLAK